MNTSEVTITMVDGTVFHGSINIGTSRRVSDYFNKGDSLFIILFNSRRDKNGDKEVYFLNRNHILWVKPEDAPGAGSSDSAPLSIEGKSF
ncbi:MAG: hypothetical protein ABFD97_19815 [Syntrophobacter sp.]